MSYSIVNVHPVLREALAVFELFRKIGFSAEQIYFVIPDSLDVAIELHVASKTGAVRIGSLPPSMSRDDAFAKWQEIARHLPEVPEAELTALWKSSQARRRSMQIMTAIRQRGIALPMEANFESLLN